MFSVKYFMYIMQSVSAKNNEGDIRSFAYNFCQIAGQTGRVTKVNAIGTVQVYVAGRGWHFNPLCLLPAPGETAQYKPHPQSIPYINFNVCVFM